MGETSKTTRPLVNLVIRKLLPDHYGYLKIGVVVAEVWPTWAIVIPSLGYQVFQIHAPARLVSSYREIFYVDLSGFILTKRGGSEIYKIPVFLCWAV